MFGLMKKDWYFYLGYLAVVPLQMLYWHTTRMQLDTTVVFMLTGWIYIVILGSIFGVEMNETKHRGYTFLATLPVTAREIVAAKLLPIFIMTGIYLIATYYSFSSLEVAPEYLAMARKWLLFNGALALGIAGLTYWVIFRYGSQKAIYLQAALFFLAFVVPIALNELVIRGYLTDSFAIFRLARETGNVFLILAGVAVYYAFYHLSVRTFEGEVPA